MKMHPRRVALVSALLLTTVAGPAQSTVTNPASASKTNPSSLVIIDTDIGDDIDDAFAVDLALTSPELRILGISGAWGNTPLRGRMLDRMMCEIGRTDIPINIGPQTKGGSPFPQAPWAEAGIEHPHGDAVAFLLDQINRHPGEITLIALAPLTNIGAAIDRDPATFRKLKRVVMMGGSVYRGYGESRYGSARPPEAEYNIAMDPVSAQKLFRSGVPIYMMPLDSTQLKFDEIKRATLATISTPMTDALQILTNEWAHAGNQVTPTMFDAVAVGYAVDPKTCPTTPLHIEVDDKGFTRPTPGTPNAEVCLEPKEEAFFNLLMPRLLNQRLAGDQVCIALGKK